MSLWQILIVVVIVLLLFGARRIPDIARNLGSGAREFKKGVTGEDEPRDLDPPDDTR